MKLKTGCNCMINPSTERQKPYAAQVVNHCRNSFFIKTFLCVTVIDGTRQILFRVGVYVVTEIEYVNIKVKSELLSILATNNLVKLLHLSFERRYSHM